jgi:C4-dicarboxylate transporter/malic acid transport protein
MENEKISLNNIIRHFSPAWYASVMGTGGLANVMFALSAKIEGLKPISVILWVFNIFLFVLFIVPWFARWFMHFDKVKEDLKHPMMSNFFVTMPVGALILGTNFFVIGKDYFSMGFITGLGMVFWIFCALSALGFGIFVIYNMMTSKGVSPELMNFSWLIPPVASIVVPLLGNPLIKAYATTNAALAGFLNLADICFLGIGLMLFLILSPMLISRFISYKMPPSMVTPTFWIILGPIGVGTLSFMGIADSSELLNWLNSADVIKFLALIIWGFGLWAIFLTVSITIRYLKQGGIPFSLSWWAFIFPLAAYTLSSINVYQMLKIGAVLWYSVILAILLAVLWIGTLARSLMGVFSGRLLVPAAKR